MQWISLAASRILQPFSFLPLHHNCVHCFLKAIFPFLNSVTQNIAFEVMTSSVITAVIKNQYANRFSKTLSPECQICLRATYVSQGNPYTGRDHFQQLIKEIGHAWLRTTKKERSQIWNPIVRLWRKDAENPFNMSKMQTIIIMS